MNRLHCCFHVRSGLLQIVNGLHPSKVVFSIPHDGPLLVSDFVGMFAERTCGCFGRDAHVAPIVFDMVHSHGVNAPIVRNMMPRALIDMNRQIEPDEKGESAFFDPALEGLFKSYHCALSGFIRNAISVFGEKDVLYVDVHGFSVQPQYAPPEGYDLILGTANKRSVLYEDVDTLLYDFLTNRGYRVFLPQAQTMVPESSDPFNGSHSTELYSRKYKINAISLEIAKKYRALDGEAIGKKLSADLAEFFRTHYGV